MKPTYSPDIGARVVVAAAKYVGLTEIRPNKEWDLPSTPGRDFIAEEFKGELLRSGWQNGWPYCAAFCEVVWKQAYRGRPELDDITQMLNPGCLRSWHNAVEAGWTSQVPQVGAIGIMRKGSTERGHAFIVRAIPGDGVLRTIEGNTDLAGDREGDGVYVSSRKLEFKPTNNLHLIGFIIPCVLK